MLPYKNILILSPHTDDSELNVGGLISKFKKLNSKITTVIFSNPVKSLEKGIEKNALLNEFNNVIELQKIKCIKFDYDTRNFIKYRQNILDDMIKLKKNNYDLIVTPCAFDIHQDHKVIYEESKRAFKNTTIFGYEVPWNHVNFSSPVFIKLTEEDIFNKWKYISCYKSQIKMNRKYFNKEFIFGLARVRGLQSNTEYAEMYQLIQGITF